MIVLSYFFLGCSIGLLVSIVLLWYSLKKRTLSAVSLPNSFSEQTRSLICILIVFFLTYFLRFISDFFVVPYLNDTEEIGKCIILAERPICSSYSLIIYYTWTSMIWDFLPLFLLFWFHHRNFRP